MSQPTIWKSRCGKDSWRFSRMVQRKTKPYVTSYVCLHFLLCHLLCPTALTFLTSCVSSPLNITVICLKQKTLWGTPHAFFPPALFILGSFTTRRPFEALIAAFYPFLSILAHRQCFHAFCRLWPSSVRTTRVRSCSAASCLSTSLLSSRMDGWAWVFSCSADAALLMVKLLKASELQRSWAGPCPSF